MTTASLLLCLFAMSIASMDLAFAVVLNKENKQCWTKWFIVFMATLLGLVLLYTLDRFSTILFSGMTKTVLNLIWDVFITADAAFLCTFSWYFINWMIISNDTQDVIGIMRLGKPEFENGILIAGESQFLSSKYWRKGHMKEAKGLFYQYVFQELSVDVLYADVWEGNTNSIKSLESYGYKLVETRREMFSKTGEYANKYIYALTRNDYIRSLKNNP